MTLDVAQLVQRRATEEHCALRFEDQQWSYREFAAACGQRAALLLAMRRDGPFHLGVLLDNVPEYPMLLGAAALAGATVVGLNPTRRGRELERAADGCIWLLPDRRCVRHTEPRARYALAA